MKIRTTRKVSLGFGVALILLGVIGIASYRSLNRLVESSSLVRHTQRVLDQLGGLESELSGAETGERGYVITGEDAFLAPYQAAIETIGRDISRIRTLVEDNPSQLERLDRLEPLVARKLDLLREKIDLRRDRGFEAARTAVLTGEGNSVMAEIRAVIGNMRAEENRLLSERDRASASDVRFTSYIIILGSLLAVSLISLAVFFIDRDIAERRSAEQALKKLSLAVEQTADSVFITDRKGIIEYVNPAFEKLTSFSKDEAIGNTPRILKSGEHEAAFYEALWKTILSGEAFSAKFTNRKKNGELFYEEKTLTPIRDSAGRITHFVSTGKDVTARKQAEDALRLQAQIIDQIHDGVVSTDLDGYVTSWNRGAERLLGYSAAEALGQYVGFLYRDDLQDFLREEVIGPLREKGKHEIEVEMRKKSGEEFFGHLSLSLLRDTDGEVIGMIGYTMDITERKRAEEALRLRALQQAAISELSLLVLTGADTMTLLEKAVRSAAERLKVEFAKALELDPEEETLLLRAGVGWKSGLVGRVRVGAREKSQAGYTLASKEPVIVHDLGRETRFQGPQLLTDHGVVSGLSVIIPGRERPFGVFGAHTARRREFTPDDIHFLQSIANVLGEAFERKRIEESQARLVAILEATPDFVGIVDLEGRMRYLNRAGRSMLGVRPEEDISEMILTDHYPPWAREMLRDQGMPSAVRDGSWWGETSLLDRGGREIPISQVLITHSGPDGGASLFSTIARDITRQKLAEREIRKSQNQLRALASQLSLAEERERRRIATEIHDRIGQSLAMAKIRLGGMRKAAAGFGLEAEFDEIRGIIEQTIQDTRSLSFELSPPILYDLGFVPAVEWLGEQFRRQHGVSVSCESDGSETPLDEALTVLLFTAVRELLVNIVKHAEAKSIKISIQSRDSGILVSVVDDGKGFDPKAPRAGRAGGFGLFSIRERLRDLGGRLTVHSKPGAGTRAVLEAPFGQEKKSATEEAV